MLRKSVNLAALTACGILLAACGSDDGSTSQPVVSLNLASRPVVLWLEEGGVEVLQKRENPQDKGWWTGD